MNLSWEISLGRKKNSHLRIILFLPRFLFLLNFFSENWYQGFFRFRSNLRRDIRPLYLGWRFPRPFRAYPMSGMSFVQPSRSVSIPIKKFVFVSRRFRFAQKTTRLRRNKGLSAKTNYVSVFDWPITSRECLIHVKHNIVCAVRRDRCRQYVFIIG